MYVEDLYRHVIQACIYECVCANYTFIYTCIHIYIYTYVYIYIYEGPRKVLTSVPSLGDFPVACDGHKHCKTIIWEAKNNAPQQMPLKLSFDMRGICHFSVQSW